MIKNFKIWLLLTLFKNHWVEHARLMDEHETCLHALLSLVSLNDEHQWSTVFDADTVLPDEIQVFLDEMISRS